MAYTRVNWENLPSKNTPVNADNLNKMDEGIANIDTKINSKQDKLIAGTGIEITGKNIINNIQGNYSTEEVKIGTWTNGKPVYRKLIYATCPNTNINGTFVSSDIAIGSNNGISFIEWGYFADGDNRIPINYSNNSGYMMKAFSFNPNTLRLLNNNTSWNGKDVVISLLFTKTTD